MRAVILAAGQGRRMGPLTVHTPKPLLPVGEDTILGRLIETLIDADVQDITLAVGYREADIAAYLATRFPGRTFHYVSNPRHAETNNIHSLNLTLAALDELGERGDLMLIESDLVLDPSVLPDLIRHPARTVALVDGWRPDLDGTVVRLAPDGRIGAMIGAHLQGPDFDYGPTFKTVNIYKFAADYWRGRLMPALRSCQSRTGDQAFYELAIAALIEAGEPMAAAMTEGRSWFEVDDPVDLEKARAAFSCGKSRRAKLDDAYGGLWNAGVIDFNYVRNVAFPDARMIADMARATMECLENYGSSQAVLDAKLAAFLLTDPARTVALNGLSQIYPFLKRYFAGQAALVPDPSFLEYRRAFPQAIAYADAVGFDWAEIEAKAKAAQVIVFVNPNIPTGSILPSARIADLARAHPDKTVIVDESFLAFSDQPSLTREDVGGRLANLIVLSSLSKSLGVPGLRLGCVHAPAGDFLDAVREDLPIWNINSFAERFVEFLLRRRGAWSASIQTTRASRDDLMARLTASAATDRVFDSQANFILCKLNAPAEAREAIFDALVDDHDLYLKDVSGRFPEAGVWARIGVRTPADHTRLIAGLEAVSGPWRP